MCGAARHVIRKTHVPVLGVIENMAWFEQPDGSRAYIFGQGGAERTAGELACRSLARCRSCLPCAKAATAACGGDRRDARGGGVPAAVGCGERSGGRSAEQAGAEDRFRVGRCALPWPRLCCLPDARACLMAKIWSAPCPCRPCWSKAGIRMGRMAVAAGVEDCRRSGAMVGRIAFGSLRWFYRAVEARKLETDPVTLLQRSPTPNNLLVISRADDWVRPAGCSRHSWPGISMGGWACSMRRLSSQAS